MKFIVLWNLSFEEIYRVILFTRKETSSTSFYEIHRFMKFIVWRNLSFYEIDRFMKFIVWWNLSFYEIYRFMKFIVWWNLSFYELARWRRFQTNDMLRIKIYKWSCTEFHLSNPVFSSELQSFPWTRILSKCCWVNIRYIFSSVFRNT